MTPYLAALFAATMLALYLRQIAADRAANLDAYNAELRQQVQDLTRDRDRYRTSNLRMVRESALLYAEAEHYRSKHSRMYAWRNGQPRKRLSWRRMWTVPMVGRG